MSPERKTQFRWRRGWLVLGAVVVGLAALPVGWYLLSPLWITRAVDEPLPRVTPMPMATHAPRITEAAAGAPTVRAATSAVEQAMATGTASAETAATEAKSMVTPAASSTPAPATPTVQPTPITLASGAFYNVVHEGSGQASILQLSDGSRVLRFEDFEVLNGPDLHVWLVPVDPVPHSAGVEIAGYADLGQLKGNVGSQNYLLPDDLDLSRFKSVVVWCQPFRVPFIAAALAVPKRADGH